MSFHAPQPLSNLPVTCLKIVTIYILVYPNCFATKRDSDCDYFSDLEILIQHNRLRQAQILLNGNKNRSRLTGRWAQSEAVPHVPCFNLPSPPNALHVPEARITGVLCVIRKSAHCLLFWLCTDTLFFAESGKGSLIRAAWQGALVKTMLWSDCPVHVCLKPVWVEKQI